MNATAAVRAHFGLAISAPRMHAYVKATSRLMLQYCRDEHSTWFDSAIYKGALDDDPNGWAGASAFTRGKVSSFPPPTPSVTTLLLPRVTTLVFQLLLRCVHWIEVRPSRWRAVKAVG